MNIWAGPKVSGELNFNANNWAYDALTGSQGIIYNSFKDSKISFYPNVIDYEWNVNRQGISRLLCIRQWELGAIKFLG